MWMKRGLCGIDFRRQTLGVASLYLVLAAITMVYGFVVIAKPEVFMEEIPVLTDGNGSINTSSEDLDHTTGGLNRDEETSEEEKLYIEVYYHAKTEGLALVMDSIISAVLTSLLIRGAIKKKSILFVPWLTGEICVGIRESIVSLPELTEEYLVVFLLFSVISVFATYLVACHFVALRKMENDCITNTIRQGTEHSPGSDYERLQADMA